MFGTTLATAPIMSSNFIGTRVFTLGLYTDVFVEDDFPYAQNSLFTGIGLKLDPTTISDTSIAQVHVLDDIGLVSYYHTGAPIIRQVQFLVPLGQYLETFVSSTSIAQQHNIRHNNIDFIGFTVNGLFNQNHIMIANGQFTVPSITDPVQFNQNHRISANGLFTSTEGDDLIDFFQNHVMRSPGLVSPTTITDPVQFNQNHIIVSLGTFTTPEITDPVQFNQNHIMIANGQFTTTEITDPADFNQNHTMVSIGSYTTIDITDPTDFSQNHIMVSDNLVLDPVKVGKPFVNPSTRRVVSASAVADNVILLTVNKENSVVILNALNNKYK
jgi:hypothetical protein